MLRCCLLDLLSCCNLTVDYDVARVIAYHKPDCIFRDFITSKSSRWPCKMPKLSGFLAFNIFSLVCAHDGCVRGCLWLGNTEGWLGGQGGGRLLLTSSGEVQSYGPLVLAFHFNLLGMMMEQHCPWCGAAKPVNGLKSLSVWQHREAGACFSLCFFLLQGCQL